MNKICTQCSLPFTPDTPGRRLCLVCREANVIAAGKAANRRLSVCRLAWRGESTQRRIHGVLTYDEVGRIMGCTGKRVEQIEKTALRKCRQKFAELFSTTDDQLELNPEL